MTVRFANDTTGNADPTFSDPVVWASSDTSALVAFVASGPGLPQPGIQFSICNPVTNSAGAVTTALAGPHLDAEPDVAVLTNGTCVVVARLLDAAQNDCRIAFRIIRPSGSPAGAAQSVGPTPGGSDLAFDPAVAALSGGGFVIASGELGWRRAGHSVPALQRRRGRARPRWERWARPGTPIATRSRP